MYQKASATQESVLGAHLKATIYNTKGTVLYTKEGYGQAIEYQQTLAIQKCCFGANPLTATTNATFKLCCV